MQTRRQFVARAGTAAVRPSSRPPSRAARPGPGARRWRGAGASPRASCPATRRPAAITLWRACTDGAAGAAAVELEVATRQGASATSSRASASRPGGHDHAVKARVGGLKAHEEYYYRFATRATESRRRALPHRAARRLQAAGEVRVLLLPGLHARLLQRPRRDGRRRLRLRRLPRRLHLRRELPLRQGDGPACATTRSAGERRGTPTSSARPSRSTTTATSTSSTAPTRRCARSTRSSRW